MVSAMDRLKEMVARQEAVARREELGGKIKRAIDALVDAKVILEKAKESIRGHIDPRTVFEQKKAELENEIKKARRAGNAEFLTEIRKISEEALKEFEVDRDADLADYQAMEKGISEAELAVSRKAAVATEVASSIEVRNLKLEMIDSVPAPVADIISEWTEEFEFNYQRGDTWSRDERFAYLSFQAGKARQLQQDRQPSKDGIRSLNVFFGRLTRAAQAWGSPYVFGLERGNSTDWVKYTKDWADSLAQLRETRQTKAKPPVEKPVEDAAWTDQPTTAELEWAPVIAWCTGKRILLCTMPGRADRNRLLSDTLKSVDDKSTRVDVEEFVGRPTSGALAVEKRILNNSYDIVITMIADLEHNSSTKFMTACKVANCHSIVVTHGTGADAIMRTIETYMAKYVKQ